ncbi:MAG: helix-turn-helix transcriptional regulator [Bacteroidales bacterium]|nr:helix-turn-helix transcriptional regulator [Bacteroidales bacterium]
MILRIILSDNLYTAQAWAAIASASIIMVSLFIFGLNAMYGFHSKVSWHDFKYLVRYNYNASNKAEVVSRVLDEMLEEADEETLKHIQIKVSDSLSSIEWVESGDNGGEKTRLAESIFKAVPTTPLDDDSLIGRFQSLMVDKQEFLQPKLTLDDVADELHSNKTYVSKMVNNTYNMGFPELVNTLRVDYAQQYILTHRDARQDEIATHSGFLSASSFNTIFKKVTGVTPKVWIASVDKVS